MKKKSSGLFFLFAVAVLTLEAQTKHKTTLTVIEKLPADISIHISKGYQVLDTASGNLNFDNYRDLIIVLRSPEEDTSGKPVKRPLLILLGDSKKGYKKVFQNDNAVLCNICGGALGDPFNNLIIKNGSFTIEHFGGSGSRWSDQITFRYNKLKKHFYLHRIVNTLFDNAQPGKGTTKKVQTQKDFGIIDFIKYSNQYPGATN